MLYRLRIHHFALLEGETFHPLRMPSVIFLNINPCMFARTRQQVYVAV